MEFTFIELFSGIGGFRLGLERSGWKCVWANDNNKYANIIYKKHFGENELDERDIREIKEEEIPEHTMLTAGFPCPSFSYAGKRKGFKDSRGKLFYEICRVIKIKKPKILFFENVRGLLSNNKGETFYKLLKILDGLGYNAEWQVLNSKDFGVPQNRKRIFIIGYIRRRSIRKIFPIRGTSKKINNTCKQVGYFKDNKTSTGSGFGRVYSVKGLSKTLDTSTKHLIFLDNLGGNIKKRIRNLIPIERERLQGFPDNWTEGLSDTQRYKTLGNAVTVNVIEHLGKLIKECIL